MSKRGKAAAERDTQRNPHEHRDELREPLARDSELDAEPALAMSLEQLDEKLGRRRKSRRYRKG